MAHELDDRLHSRITLLCEEGDALVDNQNYDEALSKYELALSLLPDPKDKWEAALWIYSAIGDTHYFKGDYARSLGALSNAILCPGGIGNPFLHLRLGECYFESGQQAKAEDELTRAYMGGGREIFANEDPKYFSLFERVLKPSPRGAL